MANLLNSVSEFMAVPPDDTNEEVITIPDDDLSPTQSHYDRKHEKLRALQTDPGTYCNEPEGKTWLNWNLMSICSSILVIQLPCQLNSAPDELILRFK